MEQLRDDLRAIQERVEQMQHGMLSYLLGVAIIEVEEILKRQKAENNRPAAPSAK